jgi:hypothetical protein
MPGKELIEGSGRGDLVEVNRLLSENVDVNEKDDVSDAQFIVT